MRYNRNLSSVVMTGSIECEEHVMPDRTSRHPSQRQPAPPVRTRAPGRASGQAGPAGATARTPRLSPPRQDQARNGLAGSSAVTGKHVLVVADAYAPEPHGVAPYTTAIAEHFATVARRVEVVTTRPDTAGPAVQPRRRQLVADVHVRRLARRSFTSRAMLARPATPDVVVSVVPGIGGGAAGVRIARKLGVLSLTVVHGLGTSDGPGGRVHRALERYALRGSDRVGLVTDALRENVLAMGVDEARISTLPAWSHLSPVPVTPVQARARLGWPTGGFIAMYAGPMEARADVGTVLEAARLLGQDHPDVVFLLIGDGSQRHALEEQAQGLRNVHFLDPVVPAQLSLALAAADVLLAPEHPRVGELRPASSLTAHLGAGRPILASAWPGGATGRQVVLTHGAAMRIDPGSPRAVASAILELRDDDSGRELMGLAARRFAEARLGRDRAIAGLETALAELLNV